MAQSPKGFMQKSLQCPVCFKTYNLQYRLPKAFPCLHSVCEQCVGNLTKGTSIQCPICNQATGVGKLITNFDLRDIVEELCQSCGGRAKESTCLHCDAILCSCCLKAHAELFHGEIKGKLALLEKEIEAAIKASMDKSIINRERRRAKESIEEITKSIDYHEAVIAKLKKERTEQVKQLKATNIEQQDKWRKHIDTKLDESKPFLRKSEDIIGEKISHDYSVEEMYRINTESIKLLTELRGILTSTPDPIDYKFVSSSASVNIGDIIIQPATSGSLPRPVTDYQHVRFKAMTGSKGSGPGEFAGDCYVTCMGDRYIVSDRDNNRLQVYDKDLTLLFILGTKGDREDQFNHPTGLCTGPGGGLFVCDSVNHRIKVYSEYLQLERTFGSEGSGDNEFIYPKGLAFTPTQLLVCDHNNYRVKVHRPDGTYIRSIGSRGSGPGQFTNRPVSVSVTPDGCVLVNEMNASSLHMFKINGDYMQTITPSVPNSPGAIQIWEFTVDSDGNIIIGDSSNHRLIVLDAGREFVCTIGSRGDQPGEVSGPVSVSVMDNRIIVVYERWNYRVQLFEM